MRIPLAIFIAWCFFWLVFVVGCVGVAIHFITKLW